MRVDLHVLGVPFWNAGYEEFYEWWLRALSAEGGPCATVFIANAHTLNIACTDPSYAACLESGDVVVNDGFGYRIAAKVRGCHTHYNFNGTDLFPRIFSELHSPLRVFLYGATEESNARTAEMIRERFPKVDIVGRVDGFGPEEDAIAHINSCKPDLLLCALGQPKQEFFMMRCRDRLDVKIQVGVGGLFDFLSGAKSRAPKLMRDIGFEWLYRLGQEPRRLFRRYVIGNPLFLVRCFLFLKRDGRRTAEYRLESLAAAPKAGHEAGATPKS